MALVMALGAFFPASFVAFAFAPFALRRIWLGNPNLRYGRPFRPYV